MVYVSFELQFVIPYAVAFILLFVLFSEIAEHFPCELYFRGEIFLEPDFRFSVFEFMRISKKGMLSLEIQELYYQWARRIRTRLPNSMRPFNVTGSQVYF